MFCSTFGDLSPLHGVTLNIHITQKTRIKLSRLNMSDHRHVQTLISLLDLFFNTRCLTSILAVNIQTNHVPYSVTSEQTAYLLRTADSGRLFLSFKMEEDIWCTAKSCFYQMGLGSVSIVTRRLISQIIMNSNFLPSQQLGNNQTVLLTCCQTSERVLSCLIPVGLFVKTGSFV